MHIKWKFKRNLFVPRYGINEKTGAALLPTALEEARTELLELYNKSNIKHYGILNCITMPGLMSYLVAVLPSTFSVRSIVMPLDKHKDSRFLLVSAVFARFLIFIFLCVQCTKSLVVINNTCA